MNNFRELKIWKNGIELVKRIHSATNHFPEEKLYDLTRQLRNLDSTDGQRTAEEHRIKIL
jgi:hypothetical protein